MNKECYVRFDDICPTMNMNEFQKAMDILKKYNVKPLLGVIPCNKDINQVICDEDPNFWNNIKKMQDEGISIAMHGCYHVYDSQNPRTILCGRKHSEFAGNSYENQCEKIKIGKEFLESKGIHVDSFFAPAHTYDNNTLKALRANGIKYNIDGFSRKPYRRYGVINIPCRCFGIPRKLRNRINVAVLHTNEWACEKKEDFDSFVNYCDIYQDKLCDFENLKKMKCGSLVFQKFLEISYKFLKTIRDSFRKGNKQ